MLLYTLYQITEITIYSPRQETTFFYFKIPGKSFREPSRRKFWKLEAEAEMQKIADVATFSSLSRLLYSYRFSIIA